MDAAGTLGDVPPAAPGLDDIEATAVAASLELAAGRDRRDAAENRAAASACAPCCPSSASASRSPTTAIKRRRPGAADRHPLFDPRSGERARADAVARREDHRLAAGAGRASRHRARRTDLGARDPPGGPPPPRCRPPLRQQIVDETLKHYNAMDADPSR